jgi:hypothetical protein
MDSNYNQEYVFHAKLIAQLLVHQPVLTLDSLPKDHPVFHANLLLLPVTQLVVFKDSFQVETHAKDVLLELLLALQQLYIKLVQLDFI